MAVTGISIWLPGLIVLIVIIGIQSIPQNNEDTLVRQKYGVVFTKQHQSLLSGHANYLVTFKIDIPWSRTVMKPKFRRLIKFYLSDTWPAVLHLHNETLNLDSEMLSLMPAPRSTKRIRKSLLGFVGILGGSLFGLANEDDIKQVWKAIGQLNNLALKSHTDTKLSANFLHEQANLTSKRFDNIQKEIHIMSDSLKENRDYIRELLQNAENVTQGVRKLHRALRSQGRMMAETTHYFQVLFYLTQAVNHGNRFVRSIRALKQGMIASDLILPNQLRRAMQEVAATLRSENPRYSIVHSDLAWYLNNGLYTYSYSEENLYVTLAIPTADSQVIYDLWKVTSMRVPLNTLSSSQYDGFTKMTNLPRYLAVNAGSTQFIELTDREVDNCIFSTQVTCKSPLLQVDTRNQTCAVALFLDNREVTQSKCNAQYSTANLPFTDIVKIKNSHFLISTMEKSYELVCQNRQVIRKSICAYCLVIFPCFCTISFSNRRLTVPFTDCSTDTDKLIEFHTFNGAVLHKFNINQSETLPEWSLIPYVTKLPSLTNITQKLGKLRIKDENDKLTLQELTKEYEIEIAKGAESMPWLGGPESQVDLGLVIVTSIVFILSTVNGVGLIVLARRLIALQATIGMITIAAAADASSYILQEARPIQPPQVDVPIEEYSYGSVTVMICCALTMVILIVARNSVRSLVRMAINNCLPPSRPYVTELYIAYDSDKEHEIIKVGTLPVSPNLLRFVTAPRLTSSSWLTSTRLAFHWTNNSQFQYFINNVPQEYFLPAIITVSWWQARVLRRIISEENHGSRLLLNYEGHDTYMQLPDMLFKPNEAPIYAIKNDFLPCDIIPCLVPPTTPRTPRTAQRVKVPNAPVYKSPERLYPVIPEDYIEMSQLGQEECLQRHGVEMP